MLSISSQILNFPCTVSTSRTCVKSVAGNATRNAYHQGNLDNAFFTTCRRLVQIALISSPIELQISQKIKQQLSTMALYLAKFDSQKVAELSQRFSSDRDADPQRRSTRQAKKSSGHHRIGSRNSVADSHSSPATRQMSGLPTSRLSKDLGGTMSRSIGGHNATETSRSENRANTASSDAEEDDKVAHQASCPVACATAVV